MQIINRNKAIKLICKKEMIFLNKKDREDNILNYWSLDTEDIEFKGLSKILQNNILANEYPIGNPLSFLYDELILLSLKSNYEGVTNNFLEKILLKNHLGYYNVQGKVEILEACPCCMYCTLFSRGEYYICPLCFWEDEGIINDKMPYKYSSPNHSSLIEAQEKLYINKDILLKIKYKKL